MAVDGLRFAGEVFDAADRSLGEARFWASAERDAEGNPWRGWLRLQDLGGGELAPGRYRVRAFAGWEAEFEPLTGRPSRVGEIDLLPIVGVGDAPWPDASEHGGLPPYQPAWNDSPPRMADDRAHIDPFKPLELLPREGRLPAREQGLPVPEPE